MDNDCEYEKQKCEAEDCLSQYREPAHYYIVTGGQRKCYCSLCFLKREHEYIRNRNADDALKKKGSL